MTATHSIPAPFQTSDIHKISILNEDAKFKGKSRPFSHQVLGGVGMYMLVSEPSFYVGLRIQMKDGTERAHYVSKAPVRMNTKQYFEDLETARTLKNQLES